MIAMAFMIANHDEIEYSARGKLNKDWLIYEIKSKTIETYILYNFILKYLTSFFQLA